MKPSLIIWIALLSGSLVGCSPRKALSNAEGVIQVIEMNQEERSEVAKAGSLLVDGVIIEMAEMGYTNTLAESVKEQATIEITLAQALIIQTELRLTNHVSHNHLGNGSSIKTSFALRSPSNLEIAASAVTLGALRAFKKSLETSIALNIENSGKKDPLTSLATQEDSAEAKFLSAIAGGQIRGISMIRDQATVADVSSATVAFAINAIATKSLEESLNLGLLNEANAVELSAKLTKTLTDSLHSTVLKDSAELAIPEVARSIIGLKKSPLSIITQASEEVVKTLGNSIRSNGLQESVDTIFTKMVDNAIDASAEVSNNFVEFAKFAGSSAKAIFIAYAELNPITDIQKAQGASDLIYGRSISAIEKIGEIPLATVEEVAVEVQNNALASFGNVGLSAEMRASVVAETTKTMIKAVGDLPQVINSQASPLAIAATFDKFTQVAVEQIAIFAPDTKLFYSNNLNAAADATVTAVKVKINNAKNGISGGQQPGGNDSSSTPIDPPLVDPVVTPPLVDPNVVTPPLVDPVVTPPLVDPVVTPPLVDPVVTPPLVDPNVVTPPLVDPNVVTPPLVDPNVVTPPLVDPNVVTPPLVDPNVVTPPLVDPNVVTPPLADPEVNSPVVDPVVNPQVVSPVVNTPVVGPVVNTPVVGPVVNPPVVSPVVNPPVVSPVVNPPVVGPVVNPTAAGQTPA